MEIQKAAAIAAGQEVTAAQLEKINRLTRRPLSEQQVYVFSVRLCDDQPDRDGERFDTAALPRLAELFVGKTGIVDHAWSSDRQMARIFETAVEREGQARFIKAWAYLLRTAKNQELIEEIDGGIKKEVSVGCSMARRVCSICGQDMGSCQHQKGQKYGEAVCLAVLQEPVDAYEFSFVAVPAQPQAGVIKQLKGGERMTLEQVVEKHGNILHQDALTALYKLAELGRQYQKKLSDDIVRMGLVLDFGMDEAVLRSVTGRMEGEELERVCETMKHKTAQLFPPQTQLPVPGRDAKPLGDEFLI